MEAVEEHYGFSAWTEIVVAPVDLCGGLPLNEPVEDIRGPLLAMADIEAARIYLLDGTDIGLLADVRAAGGGGNDEADSLRQSYHRSRTSLT